VGQGKKPQRESKSCYSVEELGQAGRIWTAGRMTEEPIIKRSRKVCWLSKGDELKGELQKGRKRSEKLSTGRHKSTLVIGGF